ALATEPHPALLFALASYRLNAEDPAGAIDALKRVVEEAPGYVLARMKLATLLLQTDEATAAAHHLRLLLGSDGSNKAEVWRLLGYALLRSGHFTAAETAYRQALIYAPDDYDGRLGLIRTLVQQSRLEEAPVLARETLADRHEDRQLWSLLASADLRKQRRLEALVTLECARRLQLADAGLLATLGDLYLDEGIPAEALRAFRASAAWQDAPVSRLLRSCDAMVRSGGIDEAEALLDTLRGKREGMTEDQSRQLLHLQARLHLRREENDAAVKIYQTLLGKNPLDGDALMQYGHLLRVQGELEEALIQFERAQRVEAVKPEALVGAAQVAVERQNYRRAAALLRDSLGVKDDPHVRSYLDQVEAAIGQ
ncbi:MAG: tetratricopeptide repeat protein, partial [Candidatus Pacebacteria bacterium]|nr:tetratricopeptide repeat protein [Candidatus Paceibacterota bacterium]